MKETEGYILWTTSKSPTGRSAPINDYYNEDNREENFNKTFLGLDFYGSFVKDSDPPRALLARSSLDTSGVCPFEDLMDYKQKLEEHLNNAIHYRENVKKDLDFARNVLINVTKSILQLEMKVEEYKEFTVYLENHKC